MAWPNERVSDLLGRLKSMHWALRRAGLGCLVIGWLVNVVALAASVTLFALPMAAPDTHCLAPSSALPDRTEWSWNNECWVMSCRTTSAGGVVVVA